MNIEKAAKVICRLIEFLVCLWLISWGLLFLKQESEIMASICFAGALFTAALYGARFVRDLIKEIHKEEL